MLVNRLHKWMPNNLKNTNENFIGFPLSQIIRIINIVFHIFQVVHNSLDPVWNQTFDFVVEDALHDLLLVEVYDHDTFGKVHLHYILTDHIISSFPLECAKLRPPNIHTNLYVVCTQSFLGFKLPLHLYTLCKVTGHLKVLFSFCIHLSIHLTSIYSDL